MSNESLSKFNFFSPGTTPKVNYKPKIDVSVKKNISPAPTRKPALQILDGQQESKRAVG